MDAPTPRAAVEDELRSWFLPGQAIEPAHRKSLTETDFREISEILKDHRYNAWSCRPRIYSVLRIINEPDAIDLFVNSATTDLSFPFEDATLPDAFRGSQARQSFLHAQKFVLTKALELEKDDAKHIHFPNASDVPLTRLTTLGNGEDGQVDKVCSTVSQRIYARKVLRWSTFRNDQKVLRDFEKSLGPLKKLSHVHLVTMVGSYTDPSSINIIMSPVADCNLRKYLDVHPLPKEERLALRSFFGCLAAALRHLHEHRIVHQAIKPENILIKSHHVYLADFGLCIDWAEMGKRTTAGPAARDLQYCAPEVNAEEPRRLASDIWSLGCVFLELWTVSSDIPISQLQSHMTTTGTGSNSYCANLQSVISWVQFLQSKRETDLRPKQWILPMLHQKGPDRDAAQVVFEKILGVSFDRDSPFSYAGTCCTGDRHDAESVFSSEDEAEELISGRLPSSQRGLFGYSSKKDAGNLNKASESSPETITEIHNGKLSPRIIQDTSQSSASDNSAERNSFLQRFESSGNQSASTSRSQIGEWENTTGKSFSISGSESSYEPTIVRFGRKYLAMLHEENDDHLKSLKLRKDHWFDIKGFRITYPISEKDASPQLLWKPLILALNRLGIAYNLDKGGLLCRYPVHIFDPVAVTLDASSANKKLRDQRTTVRNWWQALFITKRPPNVWRGGLDMDVDLLKQKSGSKQATLVVRVISMKTDNWSEYDVVCAALKYELEVGGGGSEYGSIRS